LPDICTVNPRHMLHVGLLIVATVIFFMGMRVIAFFTSRALQIPQVVNGRAVTFVASARHWRWPFSSRSTPRCSSVVLGFVGAATNLVQLVRWWHPRVARNPLLWVLFAGYACTAWVSGSIPSRLRYGRC
jgi:uncharacterized protein involved in response to NO